MQHASLLSVIVPAYNAEAYLAETIASVLAEEWHPRELIVVDDGSTDGTLAVARSFGDRVRAIAMAHGGLAAARNRGIAEAAGTFLLHIDADDLLVPGAIARRMAFLGENPHCDMVAGRICCFLSPDLPEQDRGRYEVPAEPQQGHLPGAALIRAEAFRRFGLLDQSFQVNADLEWWVRARDMGAAIGTIDDIVVRRRIHGRNLTLQKKAEMSATRVKIVRQSLERRRMHAARPAEGAQR